MPRYAQINTEGYVVSDSHLSDIVEKENMIPLDDNFDLTNKRWNGAEWEDYDPEPIPEPDPPLTEQEQIAIDTALNVEYMVCLMEANLG